MDSISRRGQGDSQEYAETILEKTDVQRKDSFSPAETGEEVKRAVACSDRIAGGVTIYGKYTERHSEQRVRNRKENYTGVGDPRGWSSAVANGSQSFLPTSAILSQRQFHSAPDTSVGA